MFDLIMSRIQDSWVKPTLQKLISDGQGISLHLLCNPEDFRELCNEMYGEQESSEIDRVTIAHEYNSEAKDDSLVMQRDNRIARGEIMLKLTYRHKETNDVKGPDTRETQQEEKAARLPSSSHKTTESPEETREEADIER